MSLETEITALAQDVAAEFNAHRAEPHGGGIALAVSQFTVDTGQNMNATGTLNLTAADTEGAGIALTGGTTVTVSFTGWIRISYGVVGAGSVARGCPEVSVTRAGSRVPGLTARHTYIRNSSGHTETSANASQEVKVTAGDSFTVTTRPVAATQAVTTQAESQVSFHRVG